MVVVAVNYPIRMMSLSGAALDKSEGIVHMVKEFGSRSQNHDLPLQDEIGQYYVVTGCSKGIDAHPETGQRPRRACTLCAKLVKFTEHMCMIRVLPPIEDTPEENWTSMYWEEHWPPNMTFAITLPNSDVFRESLARIDRQSRMS